MWRLFLLLFCTASSRAYSQFHKTTRPLAVSRVTAGADAGDACAGVCADLPRADHEAVCMTFSRYKKSLQFFVNECHARRAICKDNLLLHLVHKSRCLNSNQYFMPVN